MLVRNDMLNSFENMTPPINPTIPGFPNASPPLMNTTPTLPPTNNNPTTGKIPETPWEIVNTPTQGSTGKGKNRKGTKNPTITNESPTDLPKLDGDETADKNKGAEG